MKKEELFDAIIDQHIVIHHMVEGVSDDTKGMVVSEIDSNDQIIGRDGDHGTSFFNLNGAEIKQVSEDSFEISKGISFIEIQIVKG